MKSTFFGGAKKTILKIKLINLKSYLNIFGIV